MRSTVPLVRRFSDKLRAFTYAVSDNWLLRRIIYLLDKWECLLECEGNKITATIEVTSEITLIRYPDLFATRTTVNNLGPNIAYIVEDEIIVGAVPPFTSKDFRLSNRYLLEAFCAAAQTATLVITTHRRCECGDTDPQPYGVQIEPVGGDLI